MTLEKRCTGFTLFELIVVVTIVGILTAVGTPTFKYVTASNRVASEVNSLLGDMQFARSQAVKAGQPVTICTSTNGTACAATSVTFQATAANYSYATYNRMGYAPTGVAGVVNIQLHTNPSNNQWTRCVAVNPMGSVVTEKYGDTKFGSATTSCQ